MNILDQQSGQKPDEKNRNVQSNTVQRIASIDFTRGLVMIIMALDHVRDFMHTTALRDSPTNLQTTTVALFFTRWITYLCAPAFVFLAGTSAYIVLKRNNNLSATRSFLLTRGIWLVVLEFTVINFALWYDIHFRMLIMEVIAAIGFGFIVLSFLLNVPSRIIGIAGLFVILGHNLLQGLSPSQLPANNLFFSALFQPNLFEVSADFTFFVAYPLIPWLGILLTGFACGQVFELPVEKRKRVFMQICIVALSLFCVVRFTNFYGDPSKWAEQASTVFTFLSFINTTKYPPSLLFVLMMLGIMLLILSISDNAKNRLTEAISVYGRVPLFYFTVHMFLIHSLMLVMLFIQGFGVKDWQFGVFKNGRPDTGSGVELPAIYLIWFGVVLLLYPVCKWYGKYKAAHKDIKLLKYL